MTKESKRLPSRKRAQTPPPFRMTDRDANILLAIHRYDGMLSVDQINRWFFGGGKNLRNAQRRLSLLFHNRYIQRPLQHEIYRVPEPVVWLDKRGAQEVAIMLGEPYGDPEFKWRSSPRWSNVSHDILLNEYRHMMVSAANCSEEFGIREWRGQSELQRLFQEPVAYLDISGQKHTKKVWPDGYVYLENRNRQGGLPFLIELDNGTESNVRFGREKVSPNLHLMMTGMYRNNLNVNTGRVLAIMVGENEERYNNIRKQVAEAGGSLYFLFTRFEWLSESNILCGDVWQLAHTDDMFSLKMYQNEAFQSYLKQTVHDMSTLLFAQPRLID